jgi:hypothetical protein
MTEFNARLGSSDRTIIENALVFPHFTPKTELFRIFDLARSDEFADWISAVSFDVLTSIATALGTSGSLHKEGVQFRLGTPDCFGIRVRFSAW